MTSIDQLIHICLYLQYTTCCIDFQAFFFDGVKLGAVLKRYHSKLNSKLLTGGGCCLMIVEGA